MAIAQVALLQIGIGRMGSILRIILKKPIRNFNSLLMEISVLSLPQSVSCFLLFVIKLRAMSFLLFRVHIKHHILLHHTGYVDRG